MTRSFPISPAHAKKLTRSLWQKHVFGAVLDSAEWAGTRAGWVGWEEVGLRRVRWGERGAVIRPPNGSILRNVKPALSWHAIINLSIVCGWVRAVALCVCAPCMKRKLVASKQEISPSLLLYRCDSHSNSNSSAHHNTGWHMPYNGNASYHWGTNISSQGHTCMHTHALMRTHTEANVGWVDKLVCFPSQIYT